MNYSALGLETRILVPGHATGPALILEDTLSFWGGFNPINGEIIDVHHPQFQQKVGGSILFIPRSRGSAGTPGGIAETLRNGSGPAAFVLGEPDVNISVGTLVANRLYQLEIPVIEVSFASLAGVTSGDPIGINREGVISLGS